MVETLMRFTTGRVNSVLVAVVGGGVVALILSLFLSLLLVGSAPRGRYGSSSVQTSVRKFLLVGRLENLK